MKQGLQTGLVPGMRTGLNPSSAAIPVTADTMTPADVASIMGTSAPSLMWRGSDSSGATELVSGIANLTDAGTPTHSVSDSTLGGTVTTFDTGSTDALVAALATVGDITTGTITIMWIGRLLTTAAGDRSIASKRGGAGSRGWELITQATGQMRLITSGPGGATIHTVAIDHGTANAQVVIAKRSPTDNEVGLWTREGSHTSAHLTGSNDLTNTTAMAIGAQRLSSQGMSTGVLCVWLGADGDGINNSHRLLMAQYLGYEA